MRTALLLALAALMIVPTVVDAGSPPAWRDCNGDGYRGITIAQLNPYPAWILLDPALCPPGSAWNDGTWVTEF